MLAVGRGPRTCLRRLSPQTSCPTSMRWSRRFHIIRAQGRVDACAAWNRACRPSGRRRQPRRRLKEAGSPLPYEARQVMIQRWHLPHFLRTPPERAWGAAGARRSRRPRPSTIISLSGPCLGVCPRPISKLQAVGTGRQAYMMHSRRFQRPRSRVRRAGSPPPPRRRAGRVR